jgi:hypothetical protein
MLFIPLDDPPGAFQRSIGPSTSWRDWLDYLRRRHGVG